MSRRKLPRCRTCEHVFDPADERAKMFSGRPDLDQCPACAMMEDGTAEWAIKNDCNGLFDSFHWKREAVKALANGDYPDGYIVPVRVVEEPKSEWGLREWMEREYEKGRAPE